VLYCLHSYKRGVTMRLLKLAVKNERWDLAAHIVVLAAARVVNEGVKPHGKENKAKKGRAKR
jgi:hypothetical protein